MSSLWDIGKSSKEKLNDSWEEEGIKMQKVDQHRHKFEDKFRENMKDDVPTHPYKVYRNIVENRELEDEEELALEQMKDEFSEEWRQLKQQSASN